MRKTFWATILLMLAFLYLSVVAMPVSAQGNGINNLTAWQIAIIGLFLGNFMRSIYPYVQKLRETQANPSTPALKWDHRYTLTLLATLFTSFIGTILFFATWSPPEGTGFQVFLASFLTGWGEQDVINRLVA